MTDGQGGATAAFMTPGGIEGKVLAEGFEVRGYLSTDLGSPSLNSGSATVSPGGGLPYHTHPTGELIICVAGQADVYVAGRRYRMNAFDAIHVPADTPHGLKNDTDQPAIMHTVFPTGTPERDFFDEGWEVVECTSTDESVPESLVVHSQAQVVSLGESADVISLTDPTWRRGWSGWRREPHWICRPRITTSRCSWREAGWCVRSTSSSSRWPTSATRCVCGPARPSSCGTPAANRPR